MSRRDRDPRPLVRGGQGHGASEVLAGAVVVTLCAAGVLAVLLARAMGVL